MQKCEGGWGYGEGHPFPDVYEPWVGPRFGVPRASSPTPLQQSIIVAQAKATLWRGVVLWHTPEPSTR